MRVNAKFRLLANIELQGLDLPSHLKQPKKGGGGKYMK